MLLAASTRNAGLLGLLLAVTVPATTIQLVSVEGFIHFGGSPAPQASFNSASPRFVSSLNAASLISFRFSWTNTTGSAITDLTFTLFVDLDLDRDDNTFFNEYGEFISPLLPALAPSGAIGFEQWDIDEPEYVFGNIYTNANLGVLDNSAGVPASAPDDVSHALLFRIPLLAAGQTVNVFGTLGLTDAAGLGHFDPDSDASLDVNGYATLDAAPGGGGGGTEVPEPSSLALALTAAAMLLAVRRGGRA
ncbi:MAG: PEP-CTERM sorting domain-containing protein [Acidobacteria bacterium]|nr:PEP-CTERM sorting domain-containing protein [Acidobacteriota bacterium]